MKKTLSQVLSALLIGAVTLVGTPATAQNVKKLSAPKSNKVEVAKSVASNTPSKSVSKSTFHKAAFKSHSPISVEKKHIKGNSNVKVRRGDASNMPAINGCITYSDEWGDEAKTGVYSLPKSGNESAELLFSTQSANYGGVLVGSTYYVHSYVTFWGMVLDSRVIGYDVNDEGAEVYNQAYSEPDFLAPAGLVYDNTTSTVYGITYNSAGNGMQLATVEYAESGVVITPVAPLEGNWNSLVVDASGQLYGISYTGTETEDGGLNVTNSYLNKIDKTTGAVTLIGETGMAPQYLSGAVIDHKSGRMFWNVCPPSEEGLMCEVNLSTGVASLLYQLKGNDEIVGLYIPQPAAADGAPAECSNLSAVFEGGNLEGVINVTASATLYDGSAATGNVTLHVVVNGEEIATQEAAYGAQAEINVTMSEAGLYTFEVYASNAVGNGPKTKIKNVYVGKDTPAATTATLVYENGNMNLTWLPVNDAINGGYINPAEVTYTVTRYPEKVVVAENISVTQFSEAYAAPTTAGDIKQVYYTVVANYAGLSSEPAQSNSVSLGFYSTPYAADFSGTDANLAGWTVIDANGDGKTWKVYQGAVRATYNTTLDMDDWLISVPIQMTAGKAYPVSFDTYGYSEKYPEIIEVKYGTQASVAGMTNTLVESTDVATGAANPIHIEKLLVPEADGIYYIGFHGISKADSFYLYMNNFKVGEGVSDAAPAKVDNLTVTPDANGALKANVAFTAPSKTLGGANLSGLSKVEVLRGSEVVKTFENPEIGGELDYEDTLPASGEYTYSVYAYNENGKGEKASASAFVGFTTPSDLSAASISSPSVGTVTVSWEAVTTDLNGLTYPAGDVSYNVYQFEGNNRVLKGTTTTTSYTYEAVPAGEQDFIQCAVFPVYNEIEGAGALTEMIPVGTPYDGMEESFENGTLSYILGLKAISGGTVELYSDDKFSDISSTDGDNGFIGVYGDYLDTGAEWFTGLISLQGMANPVFQFDTYNIGTDDINEISVKVLEQGATEWVEVMAPTTVTQLCNNAEGWNTVTIDLSAYTNKVIQLSVTALVKQYKYTMFDKILVGTPVGKDLRAVSLTGPASVNPGEEYTLDFTFRNAGVEAVSDYQIKVYADEQEVVSRNGRSIAPNAQETIKFKFTMPALQEEPLTYFAEIVYAEDEKQNNNVSNNLVVTPKTNKYPVVSDLTGEATSEGNKLSWSEPDLSAAPADAVTYDFEDGESFAAEYGDFMFVDVDDSAVGGVQNINIPGIDPGTTKGSFWVYDTSIGIKNVEAHSGTKCLFALFRYDDGQTDDWAISPALDGNAQTITFYAKSYSAQYPEKIEVYYSTGSTDVNDFVKLELANTDVVPTDWTLYSVDVPEGAKRFAIRSCATSSFMLYVDDVTLVPAAATADLQIMGYEVYRDGVKIADTEECEFVDTNVVEGETYSYVVLVKYNKGISKSSNVVNLTAVSGVDTIISGGLSIAVEGNDIVILNAEGKNIAIAGVNGALVYNGVGEARTAVTVANGVYVVKADNVVKKVIVK
ncbi:MAG: choice-of-anchor J domain-containing protein [Candidatus Amulumruptor caecigallinarius]|nr:choice-of-anchor J domain-containing protein [Candidatus Amulumruptor caecigallinarius]